MEPLEGHGLQANSIGFLIDADSPAIWRGPMVTQALEQLLRQTNWRDLDYLIVDMPPGTGDVALTLAQKVPVVGAVIVTTPQDVALLDARKGLRMFQKVEVPILGVVENMAIHICSQCGHAEHIFGEGGGRRMAEQYDTPWLGSLPLTLAIREQTDAGQPTVVSDPGSEAAALYRGIARKLAASVAALPRDMAGKFPPSSCNSRPDACAGQRAFLAGLCAMAGEAAAKRPEIVVDPGGVTPAALQAITEAVDAIARLAEDQDGGEISRLRRRARDATLAALATQGYFSPLSPWKPAPTSAAKPGTSASCRASARRCPPWIWASPAGSRGPSTRSACRSCARTGGSRSASPSSTATGTRPRRPCWTRCPSVISCWRA